jgi:hypothetical protein
LQDRLAGATGQDRRFVLEAVGATILAQGDGSWELELSVPRAVPTEAQEPQIVNTGPRLGWGFSIPQWVIVSIPPSTNRLTGRYNGKVFILPAIESGSHVDHVGVAHGLQCLP